jgi:hypothetical protein
MTSRSLIVAILVLLGHLQSRSVAFEPVDYLRDVFPILETYCIGCHTVDDAQGGLVLETYAGLTKGGDSGLAVTAGVSGSSRLLLMASGTLEPVMPPDGAQGPNELELATLAAWIDQGAVGPDGEQPIKRRLRIPSIEPSASVPSPITAIALSPDGQLTARATFGRIEVLEMRGGTPGLGTAVPTRGRVEVKDEELGKVNSLVFSGDSRRLLAASGLTGAFGRAAIYDIKTGRLVKEFVGHSDTLYAAEFSPQETIVATAGYDRKILIWDVESGKTVRELVGHNGAIFDLAFSPDGNTLVSACADETVKVWDVRSGQRLDTLSQPEGEVFAVAVTADAKQIVAASADNRLRVWQLVSTDSPKINPLIMTRFLDETPIVNFAISRDNRSLVAIAESGNVKVVRVADWKTVDSLDSLDESGTDLFIAEDGRSVTVSLMNGQWVSRPLPDMEAPDAETAGPSVRPVLMDLGQPTRFNESNWAGARQHGESTARLLDGTANAPLDVPRGVTIEGEIAKAAEVDLYRWRAGKGEVWAIDADAQPGGRLDPVVTVLDSAGRPVVRVRLQAVRDSYFTFRGKDSDQINDFRLFNWQELKLGEFLFAAGEVTRLAMHPRGPDSGFDVYPGEGKRWTYFGTSGTTHALGEPAYIVRPLPAGVEPLANGLPVFELAYENDDDPRRVHGKNSRLLFTAPDDGLYTVAVTDTRGEGGDEYGYVLAIRAAEPGFRPSADTISKPLRPGTGREFRIRVDRIDGYEGPVTFELQGLPDRLVSNFPVTVESGQRYATGTIWADPNEKGWDGKIEPTLTAWALIDGRRVERSAGSPGALTFDSKPAQVVPSITPIGSEFGPHEHWTLQVRRGQTVAARVSVVRQSGFNSEVSFGKERSGKNASQGVYVDNIGLNGLLIVVGASERDFYLTADETAEPGRRSFFLTAGIDGGLSTRPITVEVLP